MVHSRRRNFVMVNSDSTFSEVCNSSVYTRSFNMQGVAHFCVIKFTYAEFI